MAITIPFQFGVHCDVIISKKKKNCLRTHKIEYQDLAALSDDDLKQFGVVDAALRRTLIDDFSVLANQNDHYVQ